jgi:alpha-tubulin suppressor-like RCC1 family protein
MARDKNGNVWAWGDNSFGQLGKGDFRYNETEMPVQVKKPGDVPLTDIVTIDAGYEHSLAVDVDDRVWVWGRNQYGQLGLGNQDNEEYATLMP